VTGSQPSTWDGGPGVGAQFMLGGTPRRNVLLGGEIGGVTRYQESNTSTVSWGTFVTPIYPSSRSGFFIRTGLGFGVAALTSDALGTDQPEAITTTGVALQAGLGFDFRLGGKFGLAPVAQYVIGPSEGGGTTIHVRSAWARRTRARC
jgi:hypothetical protein